MNNLHAALFGLAALGFAGGIAHGQTPATKGDKMMKSTPMQMSDADKRTWQRCKAMTQGAMMKDADCAKVMKAHADMKDRKADPMMKKNPPTTAPKY
jgi:hypothetical protein